MTVYLVDDDPGVHSSLASAFCAAELELLGFASPSEFLQAYNPNAAGCLLLDVQLEESNGLDFLEGERGQGRCQLPVIVVTGAGDVPTAVRAMKLGARDFIEKPADASDLAQRVRAALAEDAARLDDASREMHNQSRFGDLTQRERELVPLICSGLSNKQIAARLELSIKTVINHRAHILNKVKAVNTADLVRMAVSCGAILTAA